jgi:hypothetical protein
MPGGGAAYGKPPHEMGFTELGVETALRTATTAIIGALFGSLAAHAGIAPSVRVVVGTIGMLMFVLFLAHTLDCVREIWRRYHK